jgi:hypothetical protein
MDAFSQVRRIYWLNDAIAWINWSLVLSRCCPLIGLSARIRP